MALMRRGLSLLISCALLLCWGPAGAQHIPAPTAVRTQNQGAPKDTVGFSLLLAGAVLGATAITMGLGAQRDQSDWQQSRDIDEKSLLKTRGQSRALGADALGAVGLLTLGAGLYFVLEF